MTELLGGRILDVTHLVPTWRPPGLTVLFLRFGGRLSALLSWVDDCLSPAEVDALERGLARGVAGGGSAMKVLLVATNRERSPYPVAPLGVLCVAAAARAAGHEVDFLDLGLVRFAATGAAKGAAGGRIPGRGVRHPQSGQLLGVRAALVFRRGAGTGGNGAAFISRAADSGRQRLFGLAAGLDAAVAADCGVIGEGERAFPEVLARLEAGRSLEGIEGVITAAGDGSPCRALLAKADRAIGRIADAGPRPVRLRAIMRRGGFVGVQTKRGCPFGCVYCIYPQLEGRRYRLRPPEAVVEEIETVAARSKMRHFFFVDSVFNDPRSARAGDLRATEPAAAAGPMEAFCNPVGFDAELARAMAEAGCVGVEFGLDVATPKMLAALGKPFGQEEIRIALQAAHDAGLPFCISLLFGGPGETWADVEETQTFLNGCAPANGVFATYRHPHLRRHAAGRDRRAGRQCAAGPGSVRAGLLPLARAGRATPSEAGPHRAAAPGVDFAGGLAQADDALGAESDGTAERAAAMEIPPRLRPSA